MGLPQVNNFIGSKRTGLYEKENLGLGLGYVPLLLWGSGDNFNYLVINNLARDADNIVIVSGGGNNPLQRYYLLTFEYLNNNLATSDLVEAIFN